VSGWIAVDGMVSGGDLMPGMGLGELGASSLSALFSASGDDDAYAVDDIEDD